MGPGPVDCLATACPAKKNFVIVFGDKGAGGHNAGRLFELAARTHEKEVKASAFPGIPTFSAATDSVTVAPVSTVSDLAAQAGVGNVVYLAYFGHSWGTDAGPGFLYIGGAAAPDTNLSVSPDANSSPATKIPADKFRTDAQVRLFGCRGGYGKDPAAQQVTDQVRVPVFAYTNIGGSLFTTDSALGHGTRGVTQADIDFKIPWNASDVWLIPANGTPTFKKFTK